MNNKINRPNPKRKYPLDDYEGVCFIKNVITNPNIIIGDYTYYDGEDPEKFENNVLYHYNFIGDKLIIGRFCSIASGTKFIMNGGNHNPKIFSTYPFPTFDNGWEKGDLGTVNKGDIVIGNDVWIGFEALIMSGVKIGDGAVIGAQAGVTKDVAPGVYVSGYPAMPHDRAARAHAALMRLPHLKKKVAALEGRLAVLEKKAGQGRKE